ncbi:hypothetical protein Tco_0662453 [Tanacetum coccineum]
MMCQQLNKVFRFKLSKLLANRPRMKRFDEQDLTAHYSYKARDTGGLHLKNPIQLLSTSQPLEQKDDSNVIPDSSNICTNDNQVDQNVAECVDERAALANLIANVDIYFL